MQACEVYHRHGMDDSIADGTAHTDSDTSWPTWNMVRRVRQVSYHHKSFHLVYLPFCCCNYCICVQYWYRKVKENWCKIKKSLKNAVYSKFLDIIRFVHMITSVAQQKVKFRIKYQNGVVSMHFDSSKWPSDQDFQL